MEVARAHRKRAELLLSQRRYDHAEREIRQWLAVDPNDALAYAYLAACLAEGEKWQEATEAGQLGVGLGPDLGFCHYTLARVYADRNMFKEARASIDEALRLEPYDPDHWAVRARIDLSQKEYKSALEAAESGLQHDAEHEACINLRSLALTQLGRREEAGEAIASTLARNPLSASSHANMGWTLLNQGKARPAMEHFREALRLSPDMEWARSGVVEAMKARSLIYRLFLAYFLFMNRLKGRAQWMILIGGYIGFRIVGSVSASNPQLSVYLTPLLVAYLVFALGTVVAVPLFNLFLFVSPFGRMVLRQDQKISAAIFGVSLVAPIVFLSLWASSSGVDAVVYELASLCTGLLVIPVAIAGLMRQGRSRVIMSAVAAVIALACAAIVVGAFNGVILPQSGTLYSLACVGSIWVGNILGSFSPARKN